MKRTLTILLALCLLVSMFAACGSSSTDSAAAAETASSEAASAASESEPEAEEAAEPAAEEIAEEAAEPASAEEPAEEPAEEEIVVEYPLVDEPTTLTYWHNLATGSAVDADEYDDLIVLQQQEEITGVHIENVIVSEDAETEKFSLMIAGGDYCDLIEHFVSLYTGGGVAGIADDMIVDIAEYEDLIPNYMSVINSSDELSKCVKNDEGQMACFYNVYNEPSMAPVCGLVIRKDWLDELGMDIPETYDELDTVLHAFQSTYGCSKTLYMVESGVFEGNTLIDGYGVAGYMNTQGSHQAAPFYLDGDEVKFGLVEDGFMDYIDMMHGWYEDGIISSDFVTAAGNPMDTEFISAVTNNESGLFSCAYMVYTTIESSAIDEDFEMVGIPDIGKEPGQELKNGFAPTYVQDSGSSISAYSDNIELAIQWSDFWYSWDGGVMKSFGIEGESFEYDENGQPQFTSLITDNPDGLTYTAAKQYYSFGVSGLYFETNEVTDDVQAARDAWCTNKTGEGVISDWITLTTEETEEYNSYWSDIGTYAAECVNKFITGDMTADDFDTFKETLDSMGLQECIAIQQAAVDRFNAR